MIYVPLTLALGIFIGWVWASRVQSSELSRLRGQLEQHEQRAAAQRLGKGSTEPSAH